jgi:hypothetical protein
VLGIDTDHHAALLFETRARAMYLSDSWKRKCISLKTSGITAGASPKILSVFAATHTERRFFETGTITYRLSPDYSDMLPGKGVFYVVGVVRNMRSLSYFDIIEASIIHNYCAKLTRVPG